MLRAALLTLLVASILIGSLEAQRAGATFQGHGAGLPIRSSLVGQRSVSNGFLPQRSFPNRFFPRSGFFPNRSHLRHGDLGGVRIPYFFPDYEPFWYEQPYAEATGGLAPVVIIQQAAKGQSPTPETPPAKVQVIEVPGAANSGAAKTLPPTIFILTNGEHLENGRFVLTAGSLSVSADRHQRTIPLDMLDINKTITANRERGIDLRIPADRNEISLGF